MFTLRYFGFLVEIFQNFFRFKSTFSEFLIKIVSDQVFIHSCRNICACRQIGRTTLKNKIFSTSFHPFLSKQQQTKTRLFSLHHKFKKFLVFYTELNSYVKLLSTRLEILELKINSREF